MISTRKIPSQAGKAPAILDTVDRLSRNYSRLKKEPKNTKALINLYEETLTLCRSTTTLERKTVRTIHHLSCTGGTLICKCLAAMPNTRVLNEIDPLSRLLDSHGNPPFTPTDFISLVRQADHQASSDLITGLFLNNLKVLLTKWNHVGFRTILRDHSHSKFLSKDDELERQTLHQILCRDFKTLSIVTVRDPIDSFLSLKKNKWIDFLPKTFDEYCRRYLLFLHAHKKLKIFRYESFVNNPQQEMMNICHELNLEYSHKFVNAFSYFKFSGDSGRQGNTIEPRSRRPMDKETQAAILGSENYVLLKRILGYQ